MFKSAVVENQNILPQRVFIEVNKLWDICAPLKRGCYKNIKRFKIKRVFVLSSAQLKKLANFSRNCASI